MDRALESGLLEGRRPEAPGFSIGQLRQRWTELLAIVLFFLLHVQVFGAVAVLVQFACIGGIVLINLRAMPRMLWLGLPLLLLPLWMILSAVWSTAPGVTTRYGIQLLITIFAGLLTASVLKPHRFLMVIFIALTAVCIGSILDGSTGPSAEGPVLIGLTGSKNQMSYASQLWLAAALCVALDRHWAPPIRVGAFLCLLPGVYIIASVRSATGAVTSVVAAVLVCVLAVFQRLTAQARIMLIAAGLVATAPLFTVMPQIERGIADFTTNVLNKDPTLTGRTYLWMKADEIIELSPMIGQGYMAIFMGDRVEGLGILRWAEKTDGRSFHFHDSFRQLWVDGGLVAVLLFVVPLLIALGRLMAINVYRPAMPFAFLLVMLAMLTARAKTDATFSPLYFYTALITAICAYGFIEKIGRQARPRIVEDPSPIRYRTAE
jgi:exopolysaccharide production protein ExoQ